jgi:light-harvesting complex I chlorophyll a/b binding protein 1
VALMDRGPCVDHLQAGVIAVEALGYGDWLSAATSSTQTYFGTPVPVGDLGALLGIEFVAMAYLEAKRNEETDPVKRCYPGGAFDPMGMSKGDGFAKMKAKEIANGRLAMMAMLGFYAQTSTGSTPLANWAAHVADPWHMNVAVNAKALPFL